LKIATAVRIIISNTSQEYSSIANSDIASETLIFISQLYSYSYLYLHLAVLITGLFNFSAKGETGTNTLLPLSLNLHGH